jgi:uncharacterized protein YgiM (DUF1202 family)
VGKVLLAWVLVLTTFVSTGAIAQADSSRLGYAAGAPATSTNPADAVSGAQIVQTALKYLGYRYTTVGHSPKDGFSCIGFVSYVYQTNGIPVPDDLASAQAYAPPVAFSSLLPGDVLFFQNTVWPGLSHTAIYLGGGQFVHAEWYNRGVVVSAFYDDRVDGNYWIRKYLGANRPWNGPPGSITAPANGGTPLPSATPIASPISLLSGAPALVSVDALNLRSGPSKANTVETVLRRGAHVTIVGKSAGWDRVQLAGGTLGWVVSWAVTATSLGASTPVPAKPRPTVTAQNLDVVVPAKLLNLRAHPSLAAGILEVLKQGQRLRVIGQAGDWAQVRLPDGTVGWVYRSLLGKIVAAVPTAPASGALTAYVRVHRSPALAAPVILVAPTGSHVDILNSQGGWTQIRLTNGTTGYVASQFVKSLV